MRNELPCIILIVSAVRGGMSQIPPPRPSHPAAWAKCSGMWWRTALCKCMTWLMLSTTSETGHHSAPGWWTDRDGEEVSYQIWGSHGHRQVAHFLLEVFRSLLDYSEVMPRFNADPKDFSRLFRNGKVLGLLIDGPSELLLNHLYN